MLHHGGVWWWRSGASYRILYASFDHPWCDDMRNHEIFPAIAKQMPTEAFTQASRRNDIGGCFVDQGLSAAPGLLGMQNNRLHVFHVSAGLRFPVFLGVSI